VLLPQRHGRGLVGQDIPACTRRKGQLKNGRWEILTKKLSENNEHVKSWKIWKIWKNWEFWKQIQPEKMKLEMLCLVGMFVFVVYYNFVSSKNRT
jgi:hypothetical protein